MTSNKSPKAGFFVTGTGTGIGKTVISAMMMLAFDGDYWKPFQTGLIDEPGDTPSVALLTDLPPSRCHAPAYRFDAPLSPWSAARQTGINIDLINLAIPNSPRPLIVEGAGGLMVPLNAKFLMIDLISDIGLPVILVIGTGLGSINHALLSLEALQARGLPISGIVMNGSPHADDAEIIQHFGGDIPCVSIPYLPNVDRSTLKREAARLKDVFLTMEGAQAAQQSVLERFNAPNL